MNEKPIIFNAEMVRAILEGRKSMTRRVIKPQPKEYTEFTGSIPGMGWGKKRGRGSEWLQKYCPYGKAGDVLWVRETFMLGWGCTDDQPSYKADFEDSNDMGKWKPSIHMPRWASRINLEILDIRVERVQEIGEGDAMDEGVYYESINSLDYGGGNYIRAKDSFI